jgi:membrane protease YdiL (CAAX protease family)
MTHDSRRPWFQQTLIVARIMAFLIGCAFMLVVLGPLMSRFAGMQKSLAVGTVATLGAFALTILFARWDRLPLAAIGANVDWQTVPRFIVGLGIGSLIVGIWAAAIHTAGYVHWERVAGTGYQSIAISFLAYLVLAGREELAFHGYPLRRLQTAWGVWPSQLFIAALFAVEHILGGASWIDAVVGSVLGSLLFGMASIATEGLAVPIGLHAAWNTGHWALGFKETPGLLRPIGATENEREAYVAAMTSYVAVCALGISAFWLWYAHRRGQVVRTSNSDAL